MVGGTKVSNSAREESMRADRDNSNTTIMTIQNQQAALLQAFDEYLERVQIYAGICRDYVAADDIAGMVHAMKSAKAYLKAATAELSEIIAERVEAAQANDIVGTPAAPVQSSEQEWWEA